MGAVVIGMDPHKRSATGQQQQTVRSASRQVRQHRWGSNGMGRPIVDIDRVSGSERKRLHSRSHATTRDGATI